MGRRLEYEGSFERESSVDSVRPFMHAQFGVKKLGEAVAPSPET